jgi:hypothetical protein
VVEPENDDGFLLLSDGKGASAYWLLSELAEAVATSVLTRLVVLNCCEVGELAGEFLMRAGVKSVVAMQFILSDEAARDGSEALFRALAHRLPVDEAVYRCRKRASASYAAYAEQSTPILFLQAADGLLFAEPAKLAKGNYLRFLADRYAVMPSLDPAKPMRLEDFYVMLRFGKEIERKPMFEGGMAEREGVLKDFRVWQERAEATERTLQPVEVENVLRTKRRLVVKGDPGAGKTTLTRHLCFSNARVLLSQGVPDGKRLLPVVVRLSELAEEMQVGGDFLSCLQRSLRGAGLPGDFVQGSLHPWLANGECLVLFDGLDEVVEHREYLVAHLQNLAAGLLRECTVLLTTRLVGYANDMAGWEHYELLPFQEKDITRFVTCYFSGENDKARPLLQALRQSGETRTLATNPLLLSLICFVFEQEHLALPMRRVELYDRATLHMLKLREPAYPEGDKRILYYHRPECEPISPVRK